MIDPFLIINKFIKNIGHLVEKTLYLKKNVVIWENPQDDGGNLFVTNKKRRAYILFLEEIWSRNFTKLNEFLFSYWCSFTF